MTGELISVVLPVYNGMPYLADALDSILDQAVDFEVIVSDDGSTDGSLAYVRSIGDARIKLIANGENAGIFGNLNRCIDAAQGSLIQVFSQDDVMRPGFLAAQAQLLAAYPDAGLVYGTPDYIDAASKLIPTGAADQTPEHIDPDLYWWIASHYGALPASISSIMIPRRTFDAVGLFDPRFRVAGDLEFYHRVGDRFPILRHKQRLHEIRAHARMTSSLATSGPQYLAEEQQLDAIYRARWSAADYRRIVRFRSASRGRYHLGWIARRACAGELRTALAALVRMHRIYPLQWVLWWRLAGVVSTTAAARPTIPPPGARTAS